METYVSQCWIRNHDYLTENMEVVDDLLTFEELGYHLKSHGCHVASLSSQELSAKSSIGGCIRSLLRQLLKVTVDVSTMLFVVWVFQMKWILWLNNSVDWLSFVEFEQAADMFILASWYREQGYYENPVVVIIEDIERCCGSVLSDFIIMLRYFKEPCL